MKFKVIEIPCPHCEGKVSLMCIDTARDKPIRRNGGADGATPFPCEGKKGCGRVFFSLQALGKHRQAAHGIPGQSADAKRRRRIVVKLKKEAS